MSLLDQAFPVGVAHELERARRFIGSEPRTATALFYSGLGWRPEVVFALIHAEARAGIVWSGCWRTKRVVLLAPLPAEASPAEVQP